MTDRVDLEPDSRSAGRRTLLGFLAAFLALVAVQASFAYLAVSTDPGLASPNAYERGLAHNTVLREAASEAALGWRIVVEHHPGTAGHGTLTVSVHRDPSRPIEGLAVSGLLVRPTRAGFDRHLGFADAGTGRYVASYDLPLPGLWELSLLLDGAAGTAQRTLRISVP